MIALCFLWKKCVEKDLVMIKSSFIDAFTVCPNFQKTGVVDESADFLQAPLYRKFRRTELPSWILLSLCLGKKWRLLMN